MNNNKIIEVFYMPQVGMLFMFSLFSNANETTKTKIDYTK